MAKGPALGGAGGPLPDLGGRSGAIAHYPVLALPSASGLALKFDTMAVIDGRNPNPTKRNVLVHLLAQMGHGQRWYWFDFVSDDLEDVCSWIPWSH